MEGADPSDLVAKFDRRMSDEEYRTLVLKFARWSNEYLPFLAIYEKRLYGSTRELEYQISLAARLGYLTESNESIRTCEETGRVIHGLIQSMRLSPRR